MLSKRELLPYAFIILLIILLLWKDNSNTSDHVRIRSIEKRRQELQDSIQLIITRFKEREETLQAAIRKDLDLLEELGEEIRQQSKDSKSIEQRIEKHKKEIDRLWGVKE